ncbi:hypothetical protein BDQ12DRAFT_672867 [Crucibulum laeve]|uniref:Uncharacterized protein n=1 Tax=Crucibulum laeve TaxID=68775 RepID=A0A5C3MI78_9AGAR|nr:hypothetical protein BDQ12DRAFT_672867 [Crucibulum laeve]
MTSERVISVNTQHLVSANHSLPSLALQVTKLVDSYMLWIGIAEGSPDDAETSVFQGSLCKDWACAMPPKTPGTIPPATSLFRSSSTDIALSMAQRLAKRFQKQIFLSVDLPTTFLSMGQGLQLLQEAEKGIVVTLKRIENDSSS